MESLILSLLPLVIGTAVLPLPIIMVTLLLKSPKQSVLKAGAFVGGMTTTRLLQGLLFGFVFVADGDSEPGVIVFTLLTVLGIVFLITAYKKWLREEDPDAPPPKWLAKMDELTPLKAFGIGFAFLLIAVKFWVLTLSAIAIIDEARLGPSAGAIAFLVFILLAQLPLLLLILVKLILPKQATRFLETFSDWLNRHNRVILIAVSLIFGLYFLAKGVMGLLG
jgi:cytochrome c biogenesis protein CcdA